MNGLDPEVAKVLRGAILRAVNRGHYQQDHRLRLVVFLAALRRAGGYHDLSKRELITVLQDLKKRGYLRFDEIREDGETGRVMDVVKIEITPAGVDLDEGTTKDPAVTID